MFKNILNCIIQILLNNKYADLESILGKCNKIHLNTEEKYMFMQSKM